MKMKHDRGIVVFFTALLTVLLTACGTSVAEEDAEVVSAVEEGPDKETASEAAYIENHELEYEKNTKVTTKGTLCIGEDVENLDIIDVDWELTNIMVGDIEDGGKRVIIEQSVHGYIWTDGEIFKTNLSLPTARLCDAYTGKEL